MADPTPIEMLKNDHRKVEKLFRDYSAAEVDNYEAKKSIAEDICLNLKTHARLEEELFYPEIEKFSAEGAMLIAASRRQHEEIKNLVSQIEKMAPQDLEYDATMAILEGATLNHVQEEENQVFPFAERNISQKMGAGMTAKMVANKGKDMLGETLGL
jgi:hemerythrin superfamily protein